MRRFLTILIFSVAFVSFAADTGKVVKVLPFLVDTNGLIAKSPSLFDRDAYQFYLREHTNDISGIRYDVLWKAGNTSGETLKVRIELRGAGEAGMPKSKILEEEIAPGKTGAWAKMKFAGDDYKNFGSITSWQATLWSGTNQLSEQHSFLW